MPEQMRPTSKQESPNPAVTYERADPKREAGQGPADTSVAKATPTSQPDKMPTTVSNAQPGDKQINSEESATVAPKPVTGKDEPMGWENK